MTANQNQYRLQAPMSDELGDRARDISRRLREGLLPPARFEELSDLICDMTDSAMRHFFLRPAQAFGLGLASRGIIDLGIRSTAKTIRMALRQILPRLSPEQFRDIAAYLDDAVRNEKTSRRK